MKRRGAFFSRFFRLPSDVRGSVVVPVALALPVLLGGMSLAVETGLWFASKRDLQTAADSGALSGAWELQGSGGTSGAVALASADARRNAHFADRPFSIDVFTPPATGAYAGNSRAVEVQVKRTEPLLLARMFIDDVQVTARAVAITGAPGDYCVVALDKAAADAAEFSGNASINLVNCGVAANSDNDQALLVSGSATLAAQFIETVGGYAQSGAGRLLVETRITGSTPIVDPFRHLPVPPPGPCSGTNSYKNVVTIGPQTWCGGVTFNAQADVTFLPGVYIVNGGEFRVNAGAHLHGSGVTIILTGSAGNIATARINGGAEVSLSAPTSGTYSGVLFYQDRLAGSGGVNYFNGGAEMNLTGVIYFPSQEVRFSGGSSEEAHGCTRLFARSVTFTGNSTVGNDCSGAGIPPIVRPPRLVE
jgi:Flp pilus assembly protein TadG